MKTFCSVIVQLQLLLAAAAMPLLKAACTSSVKYSGGYGSTTLSSTDGAFTV
jgi:hypothetical protein